jgi:hypothetical protein
MSMNPIAQAKKLVSGLSTELLKYRLNQISTQADAKKLASDAIMAEIIERELGKRGEL